MSHRGNKSQKGLFFQCATRCVVQPKSGSTDGRARSLSRILTWQSRLPVPSLLSVCPNSKRTDGDGEGERAREAKPDGRTEDDFHGAYKTSGGK